MAEKRTLYDQNGRPWLKEQMLARFRFDPATGVPPEALEGLALKYKQQQDSLRIRVEGGSKDLELVTRRTEQEFRALQTRWRSW